MIRPLYVGDLGNGERFRRSETLLKHTLFEGAGESGKTTAARVALAFLAWQKPDLPMLVLDGVGALANGLYEGIFQKIEEQEAAGVSVAWMRNRVLFLKLQSEDTSGISIDLLKLRWKTDDLGRHRLETYAERVDTVMAMLAHTTEDSEDFKLIHRYARAAFTCLAAAHRPVTELPYILEYGHLDKWLSIRQQIERFRASDVRAAESLTNNDRLDQEIAVIEQLYMIAGNRGSEFDRLTGSTLRHFQWLWKDAAHLFSADTLDYGAFHDDGGILIIESSHAEPSLAAKVRRVFYGIRNAHIASRQPITVADGPRFTPSLVVIDEQQGLNAALYVSGLANARNRNDIHWFLFQSSDQIGEKGKHYNEIAAVMTTKVLFRPASITDAERSAYLIDEADPEGLVLRSTSQSYGKSKSGSTTKTHSRTDSSGTNESANPVGRSTEYAILHKEAGDEHSSKDVVRESSPQYGFASSVADQEGEAFGVVRGSDKKVTIQKVRIPVTEQVRILARHLMNLQNGEAFYVCKGRVARVTHRHALTTSNIAVSLRARTLQFEAMQRPAREPLPPFDVPKKEPKAAKPKPAAVAATKPGEAKKPARPKKQKVDASPEETA